MAGVRFGAARAAAGSLEKAWGSFERTLVDADSLVASADEAVERSVRSVIEQAGVAAAASRPVRDLARYGASALVIERLQRAGCGSLADVCTVVEAGAESAELGRATLERAREAVRTFEREAAAEVRLYPDPDARRPGDEAMLCAVYRYDRLRRELLPALRSARDWRDRHRWDVKRVLGSAEAWRLLFSPSTRQRLAEGVEAWLVQVDQQRSLLAAAMELSEVDALNGEEAWSRYEQNSASAVAILEQFDPRQGVATGGGSPGESRGERRPGRTEGEGDSPGRGPDRRDRRRNQPSVPAGGTLRRRDRDGDDDDSDDGDAGDPGGRWAQEAYEPDLRGGLPQEIADSVERMVLAPGPLVATLRRYQEFGARYLVHQERTLLGDEMGLGKTVQVLAAMCHLHSLGRRRFFVVVPNSVLVNWEREVRKHTTLEPFVAHGAAAFPAVRAWMQVGGVAITTYGSVAKFLPLLDRVDLLALDEAHYVKNPGAKRTRSVTELAKRSDYLAMMTGTALENRLEELHHMVLLAQPDLRSAVWSMVAEREPDPFRIRQRLAPVYLRRTQADVLSELPERVEIDEWVRLDGEHRRAYDSTEPNLMYKRRAATMGAGDLDAPKLERLSELLDAYRQDGRKVVVFSFFRAVLDAVSVIAGGCEQIHGQVSSGERQQMIDRFSSTTGSAVLAAQIDAGGLGINLQAAQVVILMEPQLKPSAESQAIARVHRMGQTRRVTVHRLLARDTIDEAIRRLLEHKAMLFDLYADPSSVKSASDMAVDGSTKDIERELAAYLQTERSQSR